MKASRLLLAALLLVAFAAGFAKALREPAPPSFRLESIGPRLDPTPRLRTGFLPAGREAERHAATLVELGDGRVRAFWYAGTREGAQDVEIFSAAFRPDRAEWSPERAVVTRARTARALLRYVRKLGNPAVGRGPDGCLRLYFVTVTLGGWSGSSLTAMKSCDDGERWSAPRRLVTSPFFNLSTLVRKPFVTYADGTIGLPVYHEFARKFSAVVRLDPGDAILSSRRIGDAACAIQPLVLPMSSTAALALMRDCGDEPRGVTASRTSDGGETWGEAAKLALPNPDAPVTGVVLPDGRLLAVLNAVPRGRAALSMLVSGDGGRQWTEIHPLENELRAPQGDPLVHRARIAALVGATAPGDGDAARHVDAVVRRMCGAECGFEFSYPSLIQTRSGDFHLVYTWNRRLIKHVWFNRAWLDQSLAGANLARLP
jgi:predicted neuraminidase